MVGVPLIFGDNVANYMFATHMFVPPFMVVRACLDVSTSKAVASVSLDHLVPIGLDDVAYCVALFLSGSSLVVPLLVVLKDVLPFSMAMYVSYSDSSLAHFRRLPIVDITAKHNSTGFVFHGMVSLCDFSFAIT